MPSGPVLLLEMGPEPKDSSSKEAGRENVATEWQGKGKGVACKHFKDERSSSLSRCCMVEHAMVFVVFSIPTLIDLSIARSQSHSMNLMPNICTCYACAFRHALEHVEFAIQAFDG